MYTRHMLSGDRLIVFIESIRMLSALFCPVHCRVCFFEQFFDIGSLRAVCYTDTDGNRR